MTVVNVVNVQKILVALTLNAGQYRHRVYSMLAKAEDSFRSTLNFFFFLVELHNLTVLSMYLKLNIHF